MTFFKILGKAAAGLCVAFTAAVGGDVAGRQAFCDKTPLTPEHKKLSAFVFGSAVDAEKVRTSACRFSTLMPEDAAMVIGNTVYNNEHVYSPHTMVHELTHVWQNQNNIPHTGVTGAIGLWFDMLPESYAMAYGYWLDDSKALTDYNMEQQAHIMKDYYKVIDKLQAVQTPFYLTFEEEAVKKLVERTIPRAAGPQKHLP